MHRPLVVLVIVAAASTAAADPDRCAAGLERAGAGELTVAFLDLEACLESGGAAADHRSAHRSVKRTLDDGEFALVTLATTPAGAPVAIAPLGAVAVTGRAYLPPGRYTLEVTHPGHLPLSRALEITGRYRETVELVLASDRKGIGSSVKTVDLTDEPAPTSIARGKDPEHEDLIPARFRAGQPRSFDAPPPSRSRWPFLVLGVGLAAVGAGVLLQLDDHAGAAAGLYVGGGVAAASGVTGLVLRW